MKNLLLLLVALSFISCGTQRKDLEARLGNKQPTTYILVRHAEKDYGDDPILIPKGIERADRLRDFLANVELDAVFSTDTKRTRLTATPTAKDHRLDLTIYNGDRLRELADLLDLRYRGRTLLIVGHSNTTPALTNFLTKTDDYPRFSELDYGNLFIITVPRVGKARVLKLRF